MSLTKDSRPVEVSSGSWLGLDVERVVDQITVTIREQVHRDLKRKGAIIGLSGGIDSSVVAALAVRALGPNRVLGLLMPERESSDDSLSLGRLVADELGVETVLEDITPILDATGAYERRDEMIRQVVPEYGKGYKCKVVLPDLLVQKGFRISSVVVQSPEGKETRARLTTEAYNGVVAASNFKQRARKMMEYYHADRLQYAVMGTPNRLEYDQGFFVKNGDGAADVKPIAHLYKTQVYQLAEFLGVSAEVCKRPPTTDTYSLNQSQEEFYFSLSYQKLDLCLYGKNHGVPVEEVAAAAGMTSEQVEAVNRDIVSKRKATRYQHLAPLLVEGIEEIHNWE